MRQTSVPLREFDLRSKLPMKNSFVSWSIETPYSDCSFAQRFSPGTRIEIKSTPFEIGERHPIVFNAILCVAGLDNKKANVIPVRASERGGYCKTRRYFLYRQVIAKGFAELLFHIIASLGVIVTRKIRMRCLAPMPPLFQTDPDDV